MLKDHSCPPSLIPTNCLATLRKHKDQVWFCKFNPQGTKFATVCKDGIILIWSMTRVAESETLQRKGAVNLFAGQSSHLTASPTGYKIELTHEIKEH